MSTEIYPTYYDKDAGVECYADLGLGNTVRILADQVNLTPLQALKFASGIIECAQHFLPKIEKIKVSVDNSSK